MSQDLYQNQLQNLFEAIAENDESRTTEKNQQNIVTAEQLQNALEGLPKSKISEAIVALFEAQEALALENRFDAYLDHDEPRKAFYAALRIWIDERVAATIRNGKGNVS